jgi:hypothetical protein
MAGNGSHTLLRAATAAVILSAAVAFAEPSRAETLGPSLPAPITATLTSGGAPFAQTFVTPYTATSAGPVTSWKTQFLGGLFPPIGTDGGGPYAGPGVPAGVQLKVFRPVAPGTLQVVAAGAVHDPRPLLQARFGAAYPFFTTEASLLEFTENGLSLQAGDRIGLTITIDPLIGRYMYPLTGTGLTAFVFHDIGVGALIDLDDTWTGTLPWPPALQVNIAPPVTFVRIDIKPGAVPNTINLGSNGVVAVAILSSATLDATTIDPLSVTLAGASVALRGKGTTMTSIVDVDGDGLLDLLVHVSTNALQLTDTDTQAMLTGTTFAGTAISGTDTVRVIE